MEERIRKALELYPQLDKEIIGGVFGYTDAMQGSMNMFGFAPYIADTFGISKQEARVFLEAWMKTYAQSN